MDRAVANGPLILKSGSLSSTITGKIEYGSRYSPPVPGDIQAIVDAQQALLPEVNCYEQDHAGLFAERNRWASQLASANDRADAAEYAQCVAEANLAQFEYEMLSGKDQE